MIRVRAYPGEGFADLTWTVIDWPTIADLKQILNIDSDEWDWKVTADLSAGIAKVKLDVGDWDETTDSPDEALSQAALRMGELLAQRPDAQPGDFQDTTYNRLLYGHRRQFGIA